MLIQNNSVAVSDVVIARFAGEEVIGRVAPGADDQTLRLSRPLRILLQMAPNPTTQQVEARVSFAPFIVGVDDDAVISIDRSKLLVLPLKAGKDIGDAYRQQTSSIVQSAPAGLLVP